MLQTHVNTGQITRCSLASSGKTYDSRRDDAATIDLSTTFLAVALHFEVVSTGCPQPAPSASAAAKQEEHAQAVLDGRFAHDLEAFDRRRPKALERVVREDVAP